MYLDFVFFIIEGANLISTRHTSTSIPHSLPPHLNAQLKYVHIYVLGSAYICVDESHFASCTSRSRFTACFGISVPRAARHRNSSPVGEPTMLPNYV